LFRDFSFLGESMKHLNRLFAFIFLFCVVLVQFTFSADADVKIRLKFIRVIGAPGDQPGQLRSPEGISTDPKGNIYVADTGNNRIQKFDTNGKLLNFIGGFGWDSEQFQRPVDICAENGLDVFVADYENRRIERYDKDLNWIFSLYSNPRVEDRLRFGFPNSVSLSIHGDLFIVDSDNQRVLKFNSMREPVQSFGDFDWGEGALTEPQKIHVSRDDQVYVSDRGDRGRVMVYDYYGNFLNEIGSDKLKAPDGLYVSSSGYIFVADTDQDQVFVFEANGRFVQAFGASGKKFGAFNSPSDVAVHANKLYVADRDNHRIQVFEIEFVR